MKITKKLKATKNKREKSVESENRGYIYAVLFICIKLAHRRRIVLRHYSILIGAKVCSAFVWSGNSFN